MKLLKMNRSFFCAGFLIVLCQIFPTAVALFGQSNDSSKSLVFTASKKNEPITPKKVSLDAIASLSLGSFHGFRADGYYSSFLQPNIGFEFLAEPGGPLNYLLGAHIGISDPITTAISFGLRLPIKYSENFRIYSDLGVLVFDDSAFSHPLRYGARLAFGARTMDVLDFEYRLAGEWRGRAATWAQPDTKRVLWWVGAEVGIAFSLVGKPNPLTRKDSLHASLHYIASSEEIEELDELSSDAKIDQWVERFWRFRDITPDTKINEARIEYENRVEAANRMFSQYKRLGVLTDPGRILAIYGEPDHSDNEHSQADTRNEYMVWVYQNRVRGYAYATFLFQRDRVNGDWIQIYSNVGGEITGPIPSDLSPTMAKWIGL
jgi:GWxTD domain-containing protein